MHFLESIWLYASAAIVIPVLIHLWNIKQGKVLQIGSVRFLSKNIKRHSTNIRLTELLLLLLRCILIALTAMLLAKPYWQRVSSNKGWILAERKDAKKVYTHFKPLIDSLLNRGYEFHFLDRRFERSDVKDAVDNKNIADTNQPVSYWQLLKQADNRLPANVPVYLFTDNRLNHFTGSRPNMSRIVYWKTFGNENQPSVFIADAWTTAKDSIVISVGETNAVQTIYHQEIMAADQPKKNDFVLQAVNGRLAVSYKNQPPVVINRAALSITIFADPGVADVAYVKAAFESIQQVSKRIREVSVVYSEKNIPLQQDWLFWLSQKQVPEKIKTKNLFVYKTGEDTTVHSWIRMNENEMQQPVELYKRIIYGQSDGPVIWRDGFGTPLLTENNNVYHFYSRFNPAWNEMVWSRSFPQMLFDIVDPADEKINSSDQRTIDESQLQFNSAVYKKTVDPIVSADDLLRTRQIIWVIILLVFFTERFLSFRNKKEPAHA